MWKKNYFPKWGAISYFYTHSARRNKLPRIRVEWLNTRTQEQRQEIVNRITETFVDVVNVEPDQVNIVFEEIPTDLSAKGGKFWSERLKIKHNK
jgi:4-oxalocrotonate tautomerase family enzyme